MAAAPKVSQLGILQVSMSWIPPMQAVITAVI
jgi:hypothetical protein